MVHLKSWTVESFTRHYHKGDFILGDEKEWSNLEKDQFLESILMGMPLVVYCEEEKDGRLKVVKGSQELFALHDFIENNYEITQADLDENKTNSKNLSNWRWNQLQEAIITFVVLSSESTKVEQLAYCKKL